MEPRLKGRHSDDFPIWHQQPLGLTKAEIQGPLSVLSSFFMRYSLPQFRGRLKKLLDDALCADGVDAPTHKQTSKDLEKLVEASWLVHTQNHQGVSPNATEMAKIPKKAKKHYKAIRAFFDGYTLPSALRYLDTMLKSAESRTIWRQGAPADLIHFEERIEELVGAVYGISRFQLVQEQVGNSGKKPDLEALSLYCPDHPGRAPWDFVPRSLSAKEYINPYRTVQKFTKKATRKEWLEILKQLENYALAKNSLFDLGIEIPLIEISEALRKILEAAHLINLRTILS